MKKNRHEKILEIIGSRDIETQEELLTLLREYGFEVTQATISRDIKELQLIKVSGKKGGYKYAVSQHAGTKTVLKFKSILKETVVSFDHAENIVVFRTYAGMAQAAAAAIDSMELPEVVGSVAGDDTIIMVTRSKEIAREYCQNYKELLK